MAILILDTALHALKRRWRLLTVFALLIVVYTLAGFLLVPYVAKSQIEAYVRGNLKRQVTVGSISFNPYTFAAEIRGFSLNEADGSPLVKFDLFRVDFELSSIFNRAWTFKEVRLENPDLHAILANDGLNLSKLAPPSGEAKPQPATPAALPAVRIGTLAVRNGRVAFEDRTRAQPFQATLTPIEFTLADFRTAPNFENSYNFEGSTVAGERLTWSGQFSLQPLGSDGRFTLSALKASTITSYLQDALPFDLPSGSIDLSGTYRARITDALGLNVDLPSLKLTDFAIAPKGGPGGQPWVGLPSVALSNISIAIPGRKVAVERIEIDDAKLQVWREADGRLNLMQLAPASPAPAANAAPSPPAAAQTSQAAALSLSVGTLALQRATIDAEDRSVQPAVKFHLAPVDVTVTGYSSDPQSALKIDAKVGIDKAAVGAQGEVQLSPLTADIAFDVSNFELPPFQPYLAGMTAMQLNSGQLSVKGKLAYAQSPAKGQPGVKLTADLGVANFATTDNVAHQDFIKWQSLRLTGIDYAQGPDRLAIAKIEAQKLFGKVVITPDQGLNVVSVLKPEHAAPPSPAPAPAPKATPGKAAPAMPIRIGTIAIEDGTADFADLSVEPNFAAAIMGLSGTITGLSSDPSSRAEIKLQGSVDRFSPVDITGSVNVLSAALYTDIAMNFRNMELTTFNPYSGKYAGYNISKGKLTTELKYKVDNRKLDAQHHVVLDQLEFGQATDSKDAVPLPVRLAVALLKDRNGLIDLNLPVAGSLDDPQFRLGPIIWKVVVNTLEKIVTAPFALLGSLFGGGDEIQYVDFAPGSAVLSAAEEAKLNKLQKALAERPQLKLDIPLKTITPADDAALRQAAFDADVAPLLEAGGADANAAPQRLSALAQVYARVMGTMPVYPMPASADADPTGAEIAYLESELKEHYPVSDAQRAALAKTRAEAVQGAIVGESAVAPERVFLSERESGKAPNAGTARMELTLQ